MQLVAGSPSRQYLNLMDQMEVMLDGVMRQLGTAGFETQIVLWLAGRLAPETLGAAAGRLSRRHPLATARLVTGLDPFWQVRPGACLTVQEHQLEADSPDAVLRLVGQLLSVPRDLTRDDPLSLHLIHRPQAGDVVVIQMNHVLSGFRVGVPLVCELDRLGRGDDERPAPPLMTEDPLAARLKETSLRQRFKDALHFLDVRFRQMRGRTALLGQPHAEPLRVEAFHCRGWTLDEETTRKVEERVVATCGFRILGMALLASAFRALAWTLPEEDARRALFATAIGVDLGLRPPANPLFHNFVSSVPIHAFGHELVDRDALTRLLGQRLGERVRHRDDWAVVDIGLRCRRLPRLLAEGTRRTLTEGTSLGFAFFGNVDQVGSTFCGVGLEELQVFAPSAPPAGMSLVAIKQQGRLKVQAAYAPEIVSDREAERFVGLMLDDLVRDPS